MENKKETTKVYILQERTNGIANLHYQNKFVFLKLDKAIKYALRVLKLNPTNFQNAKQFMECKEQYFGSHSISLTSGKDEQETFWRIQHMEVTE